MATNPIDIDERPSSESLSGLTESAPATQRELDRAGFGALTVIAVVAAMAALYVAKIVFVVLFLSALLAFVLEPLTRLLEKIRLPRSVAAFFAVLAFAATIFVLANISYNKAVDFAHDLPRYSGEIREISGKFRKQAQDLKKTTEEVLPEDTADKNTIRVREQSNWSDSFFPSLGTATEVFFSASFVPFLAYFMLTWKEHTRRSTVMLFRHESRNTAYVTIGAITDMVRAFIVGNFLVGLFIGGISVAIFGLMGLPFFYFTGIISGFLSLVPYLGILLAVLPPLVTGLGHLHSSGYVIVMGTVFGLHLFALNVLYPKFLGRRLQLNPLAVTVALLFWGSIWGAMGLILAIPLTAACKIICDHVETLRAVGAWLGE